MEASANSPVLPLKTVIFATDFSDCSLKAGSYASLMARQLDAELLVAHAFILSYPAMEVEAEDGKLKKSAQRGDLETALAVEATRFGEDVKRATTVLREGDPREVIPHLAEENAPSLVVLGTRGRGRMERGIVGSTAEQILRATGGPALTIGPHVPACTPGCPPFQRVLCATGLHEGSVRGIPLAVAMAQAFGASLDVLHVVNPDDVGDPARFAEIQKRFQAKLAEVVPQHADAICNPRGRVEVGSAHERIPEYLRKFQIDLLVLSLRKSSHLWLQSRLSGAFNIIANAPCPVLTIAG